MVERRDEFYAKFEELGEAEVRSRLHTFHEERRTHAQIWLSERAERKRSDEIREATDIAKQALDAAQRSAQADEEAALYARNANRIAVVALLVSFLALLISIWQ